MSSLGLTDYQPLSPLEPEPAATPKSAAKAFLISLLLPGIGQIYAKRATAGWITFAFFSFFLLGEIGLRVAGQAVAAWGLVFYLLSLYIFAFLDAYFSTLEYNQGISSYLIGGNPRIACILNFLTNGIGYFYLGERSKGILMVIGFVLLRQFARSWISKHSWINVVWIILQCLLAFDAYRLARKRLLESFPQMANHSWRASASGQLTPAVPVSAALVLIVGISGLVGLGLFARGSDGINAASMDIQTTPEGTEYSNKALGLKLVLPDHWQIEQRPGKNNLYANKADGSCRIILMRAFSWSSPETFQKDMEREIARKPGFSVYGHAAGQLGNLPAAMMRVGLGTNVTEQIATAKIGRTVYTLIEVDQSEEEACTAELNQIRNSFRAQR